MPRITVIASLFSNHMARIAKACDPDRISPALSGVSFTHEGHTVTLAATDGKMLAESIQIHPCGEASPEPVHVVFPWMNDKPLQAFIKAMAKQPPGREMSITVEGRRVVLECGGQSYTAVCVDCVYPNYKPALDRFESVPFSQAFNSGYLEELRTILCDTKFLSGVKVKQGQGTVWESMGQDNGIRCLVMPITLPDAVPMVTVAKSRLEELEKIERKFLAKKAKA